MLDKGYGVIISECKFKEDAAATFMNHFALERNDQVYHAYAVFCDVNGYVWDDNEAKTAFAENFDDECTGFGLEGLVARVIDDAEFEGAEYFITRDDCLYVPAIVPVDNEDKQAMPTQKDIQKLLAEYLNPLLETPVSVGWVEVAE